MKILTLLLLSFLISCGSGGGGGNDQESTAPQLKDFVVHGQSGNPSISSKCENTYLLDTKVYFQFEVYDPDKDATKLFFIIYRQDNSIYEEGTISLPQQQFISQIYITEWSENRLDEEGYFTLVAYIVDKQGLESDNFIFEGCVFDDWQV